MKYYHGSRSKFNDFSIKGEGKHGQGFYFTADKNEACYFAKSLYGNGVDKSPTLYTVQLKVNNPFNTMSVEDCQKVMKSLGLEFKPSKNAGGAKEHYHYLEAQLKRQGINIPINDVIKQSGFDAVFYEFMHHMIVFDSSQVTVLETEPLDF